MRALSIRQPFAEMILRGIKTIEYRSRPTRIIGERFLIYASKSGGNWREGVKQKAWSLDLAMPGEGPAPWIVEMANALKLFPDDLPIGVIVGSAVIEQVSRRDDGMFQWHLTDVQRATTLRKPTGKPQPVWFNPF